MVESHNTTGLGMSTRTTNKLAGEKQDVQGELKIKFTDSAKQPDMTQPFNKEPVPGKTE